ncbi:hypothetical protein Sfulv_46770 [Streptomyces fulvorobeus]|uniref:Uncharacterized protein n=1 Tax=Streptomyces fulvorobeus TaxID=284028 RepID=A0A7J0CDU0_9ACTN|nr:hypothetical protein Sfulv_46770 [Streptomyces fulvorobeus]
MPEMAKARAGAGLGSAEEGVRSDESGPVTGKRRWWKASQLLRRQEGPTTEGAGRAGEIDVTTPGQQG